MIEARLHDNVMMRCHDSRRPCNSNVQQVVNELHVNWQKLFFGELGRVHTIETIEA